MISNNSTEPQAQHPETGAGKAAPAMDPRTPIEVASTGTGAINDPSGTDGKPPKVYNLDLLA
ncbi:MAG TPA: hypothetical protein VGG20_20125 [Thermoanaerobaculia bacterium]